MNKIIILLSLFQLLNIYSFAQPQVQDLFANISLDLKTISNPEILVENDSLTLILNQKTKDSYFKLNENINDPILLNSSDFEGLLETLFIPDSTLIDFKKTEILSFIPSKYIYEIEVSRFFSKMEGGLLIYNVILEKLIQRIEKSPRSSFSSTNSTGEFGGISNVLISSGMTFYIDNQEKDFINLSFEKTNSGIYRIDLVYHKKDY